jgi:hypothetical protein
MGGTYLSDAIEMGKACTAEAKAVVLVNPGQTATLTSQPPGVEHAVTLTGQHAVIDGLHVASPGTVGSDYDVVVGGSYNALLNVECNRRSFPLSSSV